MKKILIISSMILSFGLIAETYKTTVDSKHYKGNIVEGAYSDSGDNSNDSTPPVQKSPHTSYTFIETDVSTTGDKRATLDTATGLEWLDLSLTTDISLSEMQSLLSTTYNGWRFPTKQEVNDLTDRLFPSASFPHGGSTYTVNAARFASDSARFLNLFGTNYLGDAVFGLYQQFPGDNSNDLLFGLYQTGSIYDDCTVCSPKHPQNGVFLVSAGGTTLSSQNDPTINIPYTGQ